VGQGEGGLQILVGQVEPGEGGLEIFVGQVGQGQGVCPLEPFHLSQMGLQGREQVHPPSRSNCTLFCLDILFLYRSLRTDPRTFSCKRLIEDFHQGQIVKFVSFTGAFTGKYVVKSVTEACETVHNIPKETCQHATQFVRPCKTACFW